MTLLNVTIHFKCRVLPYITCIVHCVLIAKFSFLPSPYIWTPVSSSTSPHQTLLPLSYRDLSRVSDLASLHGCLLCSKSENTYAGMQWFYYSGSYISQTIYLVYSLEMFIASALRQISPCLCLCFWAEFSIYVHQTGWPLHMTDLPEVDPLLWIIAAQPSGDFTGQRRRDEYLLAFLEQGSF